MIGEPLLEFAKRVAQAHAAHVGELKLEPQCAQARALLLAPRPRHNHHTIGGLAYASPLWMCPVAWLWMNAYVPVQVRWGCKVEVIQV